MSTEYMDCEVCGITGARDRWYNEPRYDDYGRLIYAPYGERGQIGHREKIVYFRHNYGFYHIGMPCCDVCHSIVVSLTSKQSVFDTREKFHEYVEKRMKFRALARNMSPTCGDTNIGGMLLYTHYNRNFTKGLKVKIPGSDDPETKNNVRKCSKFEYVIITNVYSKEDSDGVPWWGKDIGYSEDKPFVYKPTGRDFDYYIEVIPYEVAKQNAYNSIVKWWKSVRPYTNDLDSIKNKLEDTDNKLEDTDNKLEENEKKKKELKELKELTEKIKVDIGNGKKEKLKLEASIKRISNTK